MSDQARRKELREQYDQTQREAGVYRIFNQQNNKSLLGSSPNLASVRGKMDFAKATNTPSALDQRLRADIRKYGIEAFSLEILEVLETKPETTPSKFHDDLAALEALWREKFEPSQLY